MPSSSGLGPDPSTLPAFTEEFEAALREDDRAYLLEHLHPAVIDRYGRRACRAFMAEVVTPEVQWEVIDTSGPAPWPYASDSEEVVIDDTWFVRVSQTGDPPERELHFAPAEGTWRWFTDCGEPAA